MKSALYISNNEQFRGLFAGALKPLGFKAFHYVYSVDSALRAMKRQPYAVVIYHDVAMGRPKELIPIEKLRAQTEGPLVLVGYPANFFELAQSWVSSEPQDAEGEEPAEDGEEDASSAEPAQSATEPAEDKALETAEAMADSVDSDEGADGEAEAEGEDDDDGEGEAEGEEEEAQDEGLAIAKNCFITPSPISAAGLANTVREATTPKGNPLVARLMGLPGFKVFSQQALTYLISHLKAVQLSQGETLFEAGQAGKSMFFVLAGGIDIRIDDEVVETVGTGGVFGEMAMLEGEHRSADAIAASQSLLLEVSSDQVEKGDHEFRGILYEVLSRNLVRRLRETNRRLWSQD